MKCRETAGWTGNLIKVVKGLFVSIQLPKQLDPTTICIVFQYIDYSRKLDYRQTEVGGNRTKPHFLIL